MIDSMSDQMFQRNRQIESVEDLKDELTVILAILWDDLVDVGIKNVSIVNIAIDFEEGLNKTQIYKKQQLGGELNGEHTGEGSGFGSN